MVVAVQHVEAEGPSAIATTLERAGIEVRVIRVDRQEAVPATVDGLAGVVVMGGPMSAASDEGFPSRSDELALLADALARGVPILGVCLGAQLLAAAAGGRVLDGHGPEVGWGPIDLTRSAALDPLLSDLPRQLVVLHWHGQTYELPDGAVHLARSAAYEQQAFRVGRAAWGFQCHLEVDVADVARFAAAMPGDADQAPGGAEELLARAPAAVAALRAARSLLLTRFASGTLGRWPTGR